MTLNFKWDMNKETWEKLVKDYTSVSNEKDLEGTDYGCVYVGKLAIDLLYLNSKNVYPDNKNDKKYLSLDIYAIYINDTGYGYTPVNHTPYGYADSFLFSPNLELDYNHFKLDIEKELTQILTIHKDLWALADQPLGKWD